MPDVVTIILEGPKCARCGKELPRDRKKWCYECMPKQKYSPWRKHNTPPEPGQEQRHYTLADRVAQARAYGLGYGQLMAHIENGWKLPPMIRPVEWPEGSEHKGE